LDGASRAQLQIAIATGPEDRVREAFEVLVSSLPVVPEQVFRMLVAEEGEGDEKCHGRSIEARRVELVPRWQICRNCQEEFDAGTPRVHGECAFHSGELEVNEEEFVDWDENCHGPMDTEENRQQWPENFTWTCCEGSGIAEGCEIAGHEPELQQDRRKRAR
ncbi:hypothetical protein C8Q80DRAFT_1072529, partial [Daedaleopsis nitida]